MDPRVDEMDTRVDEMDPRFKNFAFNKPLVYITGLMNSVRFSEIP